MKKTRYKDIAGNKIGRLTALYWVENNTGRKGAVWHCRCDCGNELDISYNKLMYSNVVSCGCRRQEHAREMTRLRPLVDETALDNLRHGTPSNNTSGHKGVYLFKGKYMAQIKFKKKTYYLGLYSDINDAVQVRRKAEDLLFGSTMEYFKRWEQRALADPDWASANPVSISVLRDEENNFSLSFYPPL